MKKQITKNISIEIKREDFGILLMAGIVLTIVFALGVGIGFRFCSWV